MAPSQGLNDGAATGSPAAQPHHHHQPPPSRLQLLSCLQRVLCLCGTPAAAKHDDCSQDTDAAASAAVSPPATPAGPPRVLHHPSLKTTSGGGGGLFGRDAAPPPDLVDSQVALYSSIMLSIRGGTIDGGEDVTLSCMDPGQRALEAATGKSGAGAGAAAGDLSQQLAHPVLLTTLTFAAVATAAPGSVTSQRLSPTNFDLDLPAATTATTLHQYSISSYAINAAANPGANSQQAPGPSQSHSSTQPGTYIDLPQMRGSPGLVSPLLLAPPERRGLRPPPLPLAAAQGGDVAAATTPHDAAAAGADVQLVQASPPMLGGVWAAGDSALAGPATALAQRAEVHMTPPQPPLRGLPRPISAQALSEQPPPPPPQPAWPGHGHGHGRGRGSQGHSLAENPSAQLPSLWSTLHAAAAVSPSGLADPGLQPAPVSTRHELPNRRPGAQVLGSASVTSPADGGAPPFDATAAAAAAAVADANAAIPSPFVAPPPPGPPVSCGASGVHPRQHYSVSGVLSYGYGSGYGHGYGIGGGGSGNGYVDMPGLLTDGRSAALSGHGSGTLSQQMTRLQYGAAAAAALTTAPYGPRSYGAPPPPPSPPRSSVGLVVPSRMSVSGAGSVLSLPIETSSLYDVTAPRTGLLPEHTALEMGSQAPALDLWAAASLVSPINRIAQGAYGVVYRGLWHGCTCAVKLMLAANSENLSSQLTEVFLCKALSCHPNIVQTFDCNVWRITTDTLQAVRSFCGGTDGGAAATANGVGPYSGSPYGTFGAGAAAALGPSSDSPLPLAAMIKSAASVWLGASPSPGVGLSAAPSGVPSAASNIGPYGLTAMGAVFGPSSQLSIDSAPPAAPAPAGCVLAGGVLAGPGSTSSIVPQEQVAAAAAAAAVAAPEQGFGAATGAAEALGAWGGPLGAALKHGHAEVCLPPPPAAGNVGAAAVVAAAAAAAAVVAEQRQWRNPESRSYGAGPAPAADASPQPTPQAPQPEPHISGHHRTASPQRSPRTSITASGGIPPHWSQGSGCEPRSLARPLHPASAVTDEWPPSGTLLMSGALPNLRPPVSLRTSLPPSQPLTAGSLAPSSVRSDMASSQPPPPPQQQQQQTQYQQVRLSGPESQSAGVFPTPPEKPEGAMQEEPAGVAGDSPPGCPPALSAALSGPQRVGHGDGGDRIEGGGSGAASGSNPSTPRGGAAAATEAAAAAAAAMAAYLHAGGAPSTPTFIATGSAGATGAAPTLSASRFASSNASRIFQDVRWPSPDCSSRGPSPALALGSRHASGGGSAAAAAALAARTASCSAAAVSGGGGGTAASIPLSAAQVASTMGMGLGGISMGLCSSPVSSGVLPPSLLQQPGSASSGRACRRLSDRAFAWSTMGAGSGYGGPGPLQARSAVSVGDDSDAVATMAGARNLAQVLNLLGARDGQLAVLVVMEECDRGSLQQLLSKATAAAVAAGGGDGNGGGGGCPLRSLYAPFSGGGRYPPSAALRALVATAREIALGMAFLHHHNIIHGDLKPGNVLLKSSRMDQRGFVAKISDFGLSRVLHNSSTPPHLLATGASGSDGEGNDGGGGDGEGDDITGGPLDGTVPYLAPELINNGQRSKASDVWAYGVLLWQLVTGMRPYDGLMQWQIMAAVCSGEQLLSWPQEAHPGLVLLGRACLAFNPRDRPAFAQVVRRLQALESELRSEAVR